MNIDPLTGALHMGSPEVDIVHQAETEIGVTDTDNLVILYKIVKSA